MKYDGVIIMMAVANLAMFAAGACLILKAWVLFVICLGLFLAFTCVHAWYLATLRQRVKKELTLHQSETKD